ncbi:class I SAM-dependent methyltransferase [Mesobaculum littorinae]|uniref:Class I SAM-dependent methyltransferase n=1 Tax=Mesobaculum littorinae TaxID=2486419 RepID=A0A438AFH7_9RHOB|nr:methyltransferase [Mesobaculum littorinae]RVV97449.1 class I SAM-dependent methyltransferase [Mesobaculum littorinae]
MLSKRLPLAAERGLFEDAGRVCVLGARGGDDLTPLGDDVVVVQGFAADHQALSRRGLTVVPEIGAVEPGVRTALVVLPRSKEAARDRIARAADLVQGGPVFVDGQKTEGIDALLRDCRAQGDVDEVISKAHGKIFRLRNASVARWRAEPQRVLDGYLTAPGVFSADGVDRGSALLADALVAAGLKGRVADLGAGWGYLSARLLKDAPKVVSVDLVEAEHAAVQAARQNVTDPRAAFHWADVTRWKPAELLDHVIMNPPFHQGRAADPGLGRAFIAAAAAALAPSGTLWLVANRHLPYESALSDRFARIEDLGGDTAFKLYRCEKPRRGR